MSTILGSLRRLVLAPSLHDVSFAGRGFPITESAVSQRLEAVPQSVVCGFEWGVDGGPLQELERRLDMIEPELRGFAYEGATMALTVRDVIRGERTRELLLGPGHPHIFLAYIGIGFAMARLPRRLWRKVLPDLSASPYHPVMSWLAVDGYGFDLAYFHTGRWVDEQRVPQPYPWQGFPDYFPRACDQGIGRALWFIHAADVRAVATAVERFARQRQADLWSGVGLAATFAGGASAKELEYLGQAAGEHSGQLAVGSVFAAKARDHAGFVPAHSATAVEALTGRTVAAAVEIADRTTVPHTGPESVPQYEVWRERIRAELRLPSVSATSK